LGSDRAAGLDAIMLAPTRDLVADLNRRARQHRLRHAAQLGREVQLGDGNQASIGDVIITRTNDRRLRLSASDWVKNGDRWSITHISRRGELTVRHQRSRLTTRLPADYVGTSTGLGYATTIQGAQGVSADTMHGLLTGQESRQQVYTMLTRGRHANHLYLQVVGDGDPYSMIRPDAVAPRTPTETLQQILARDDSPTSATTTLRELHDPAARLFDAVQRYTDSLHAAERLLRPQAVADLDTIGQYIPGLTGEPAWPTLRAHLLDLAAETGHHPLRHLHDAARGRDLSIAGDMAAVLYWGLPETAASDHRPLPWLPGIPTKLQVNPVWGDYLTKRSQLIADLADHVREQASRSDAAPAWAPPGSRPSASLLEEVAVWRAANGINPNDLRATGGPQLEPRADLWRQHLDRVVANELSRRLDLDQRPARPQVRQHHHGDLPRLYQRPSSNRPPVLGP
jgi:hypothetical protein